MDFLGLTLHIFKIINFNGFVIDFKTNIVEVILNHSNQL